MTTEIYKVVTSLTTASLYSSEIAVLQTKCLDMSQSMLTTQFSIINQQVCVWKVSFGIQNYFRIHVFIFLMAELFFGAKIIPCHRFNTDGRLNIL
jgi:hypothetical protein